MTWQRIDEDAYIDDTLVTCAEYQLFIDEMREQGRYCQPDCWTSFQFQNGQAKNPILGARLSDAQSFCEWLTQRESNEWHYRIPRNDEVVQHSLMALYKFPLGYWVSKTTDNHQEFVWLSEEPLDARLINNVPVFETPFSFSLDGVLAQSRIRFLDLEISTAELENSLHIVRKLSRGIEFLRIIDLARGFAQDIHRYIFRTLYIKIDIPRAQRRASDISRILKNILVTNANQKDAIELTEKLDQTVENICKVSVDLFTLQERIAGRSPAFEGIRLVKERVR